MAAKKKKKKKKKKKRKEKTEARAKTNAAPKRSDATALPKIGSPATNALAAMGITTLEGVAKLTPSELLQIHGVGPKAVKILTEALGPEWARG